MSERPGHLERTFWFYNLDVVLLFFLDSAALLLHVRIASVYIYFDFFFFLSDTLVACVTLCYTLVWSIQIYNVLFFWLLHFEAHVCLFQFISIVFFM